MRRRYFVVTTKYKIKNVYTNTILFSIYKYTDLQAAVIQVSNFVLSHVCVY